MGLVGVVITVLSIPGDTQLQPLSDDLSDLYTGPDPDDNVSYVAACPRTDHALVAVGVTDDGYGRAPGIPTRR